MRLIYRLSSASGTQSTSNFRKIELSAFYLGEEHRAPEYTREVQPYLNGGEHLGGYGKSLFFFHAMDYGIRNSQRFQYFLI